MSNSVHQSIEALRAFYENLHIGHNAAEYRVRKSMNEADLVADLAVAKMSEKLTRPRLSDNTITIDARGHTTPEAVEQAAREAVVRAAPNILKNDFKAELSKSLDELRDAAFELLVALKDRQDAKRGAKS